MRADLFDLPEGLYLCGHSLGPPLKSGRALVEQRLAEWAKWGALGWFEGGWIDFVEGLRAKMAPIVGGRTEEVAIQQTLTANLHQMLHSFYVPEGDRNLVVMDGPVFPSDRYAVESFLGGADRVVIAQSSEELEELAGDEHVALLLLSGVNFYTGELLAIERLTRIAHGAGAMVGGILAHAVGNVPLALHDWEVDFAVWCTYKYLNGGPGSPGGLFVHERHFGRGRLTGWWGEEGRFAMEQRGSHQPRVGAAGWELSTPSPIALAPLAASLDLFNQLGMERLRAESVRLTDLLEEIVVSKWGVQVLSPKGRRGAMLSLAIDPKEADRFCQNGVICDGRRPGVVRMTPAPLFVEEQDLLTKINFT